MNTAVPWFCELMNSDGTRKPSTMVRQAAIAVGCRRIRIESSRSTDHRCALGLHEFAICARRAKSIWIRILSMRVLFFKK